MSAADPANDNARMIRLLIQRGILTHVGWAYPAQAANPEAAALVEQFGDEYGPWQLLERTEGPKSGFDSPLLALDPTFRSEVGA